MSTTKQYVYKVVAVERFVDGDTFWLRVDVGFREWVLIDCRLDGYDTAETHMGSDTEKAVGRLAASFTEDWLTGHLASDTVWVQTEKDPDSFGRWLGTVWYEAADGTAGHLGVALRALGYASVWPTRWHEEYDPQSTYWSKS